MIYPDEILQQVKRFGFLQYGIDKILSILSPEDPDQFVSDLRNEETTLFVMYHSGLNTGQYNLDAAEFKLKSAEADKMQLEVKRENLLHEMINDFCGNNDD